MNLELTRERNLSEKDRDKEIIDNQLKILKGPNRERFEKGKCGLRAAANRDQSIVLSRKLAHVLENMCTRGFLLIGLDSKGSFFWMFELKS